MHTCISLLNPFIHSNFDVQNLCFILCLKLSIHIGLQKNKLPKSPQNNNVNDRTKPPFKEGIGEQTILKTLREISLLEVFWGCFVFMQFHFFSTGGKSVVLAFFGFFPPLLLSYFFALSLFFILSINVTNIISRNKIFRKSMNLLGL